MQVVYHKCMLLRTAKLAFNNQAYSRIKKKKWKIKIVTQGPYVSCLSCVDWQWQSLHLMIADWCEQGKEAHTLVATGLGKNKIMLNILQVGLSRLVSRSYFHLSQRETLCSNKKKKDILVQLRDSKHAEIVENGCETEFCIAGA